MADEADIIVAGGGLTGLAAAVALGGVTALRPAKVVLIDARDPREAARQGGDGRATAITASSRRMCEALGIWTALAPHAEAMREIVVTDSRLGDAARPALLHFGEEHRRGEPSAYMIENHNLIAAFLDAVEASAHITLLPKTPAASYAFGPGRARIATADGRVLKASLIAAADGHDSPARKAAGIETVGWDYGQAAIVATVAHELPHGGRAEEHFLPAGPFAILPLTGNRCSLVWTEASAEARRLLALDDDGFHAALMLRFGQRLGTVRLDGPRRAFPLSLRIARDFAGERLALLGDAAHVVHPIAGLGLNLALRDVAALAECVSEALRLGLDPGSRAVLDGYVRWRRFDTVLTAVATDGLNRLFSTDNSLARMIRDLGLAAADRIAPLKPLFMREAAGESGRLPKLLRGEPV